MPDWVREIRRRLTAARLPAADESDVVEEMSQHLDDRYRDLRAQGASDDDAVRGALAEMEDALDDGGRFARAMRDAAETPPPPPVPIGARPGGGGPAGVLGDLRFGARMLRRAPGFTLVAVLTIALGIGANTTIFSIVNALLLRPLPAIARQDELVLLGRTDDGQGFDTFSYPDYLDYRDGARTLAGVGAYYVAPAHLQTGGPSQRVRVALVSGNYFQVLGTPAARGRPLGPDDDRAGGASPVIVLSDGLWRSRFGAEPEVVGRTVGINGHPFTVIGIAPRGFHGVEIGEPPEAYVPIATTAQVVPDMQGVLTHRGAMWLSAFARLAPGTSAAAARAELSTLAAALRREHPATNAGRGVVVAEGLGFEPRGRDIVERFAGVLLGVVALVLLIACANVANLLLARGAGRERELAVRAALGASRGRLMRQLLAEGALLALLGGAAGLLLGIGSVRLMLRLRDLRPLIEEIGLAADLSPDARVLAFTAAVAVGSALLFGLPPALRASRVALVDALKAGTPGSGQARSRLRNGLVVAQLALSLVLLVAAGLFVRTLRALYAVPPGFETRQVLVASVDVGLQGYDEARGRRFYDALLERAAALPGVRDAALAHMLPLGGGGWDTRIFAAEASPAPEDDGLKTDMNAVTPGYFTAVGMPLVRGRGIGPADAPGAPLVAVVNEALAEQLWPGADPVGRRFRVGRGGRAAVYEVVGLVRTAKYRSLLETPRPYFYRAAAQTYLPSMTLHLRADGDPRALIGAVERAVAELDPTLPLYRVSTLARRLDESLDGQRTLALLVGVYGALALALAAVGLYGSMAYAVSRRTREIGIRMALGAPSRTVMRHVLLEALRVAGLGAAIGLATAIPVARLLRSQLFGVGPGDPVTLLLVALLLVTVTLVAAFAPARRATRVDPMEALRAE